MTPPVMIIGGGLAGLACARRLQEHSVACRVLEAEGAVGGRVRTDTVDGFRLDRGFQVLLTAYPETRELLDYSALRLGRFQPGALVRYRGEFRRFADPYRQPRHALATALSPLATLADKLKIARLKSQATATDLPTLYQRAESTTIDALRDRGFSDRVIESFFRPFLSGIFLESELATSSRMFEFVFRMFSLGDAALPAGGMQALPEQLASGLSNDAISLGTRVLSLSGDRVGVESGHEQHDVEAATIVMATDRTTAHALATPLASSLTNEPTNDPWCGTTCFYFACEKPPIGEPILVLNGEGHGPINSLCVPSLVAAGYAPGGANLVSISVVGASDDEPLLRAKVLEQLEDWFGGGVARWRHLRSYTIRQALPSQPPGHLEPVSKPPVSEDGLIRCGDWLDTASIQGAMASGRRAAEAVVERLRNRDDRQ